MISTWKNLLLTLSLILMAVHASLHADIKIANGRSTLLYGSKAEVKEGALNEMPGRYLSWSGDGLLAWRVTVPSDGRYELYITANVHERAKDQLFKPHTGSKSFDFKLIPSKGIKIGGKSFQRTLLSTGIDLKEGVHEIEWLTDNVQKEGALLDFRSLELLPLSSKNQIEAEYKRALRDRASVKWLQEAGYGLIFHWTSQSVQRDGSVKSFAEAVNEFDTERFANMVEETGAGYVMFTIGHAESYCPAPIQSWEKLHPGKTTDRDLIREIAAALSKKGVRLICYINGPLGFGLNVKQPSTQQQRESFTEQFQSILNEMGNRYGPDIAGYWFDSWYQIFEEFPDVPFERFFRAAKSGNLDRIICLNSWIYPPVSPWQEYWAGEVASPVALPVDGYMTSGPVTDLPYHALLIMEPYWVQKSAEMPAPRFTSEKLSNYILNCMQRKGAVTINLGVYQDGSIGAQALQVMKKVKEKVR